MTLAEILTIVALIVAPVAAVQVQKRLDILREERGRKMWVFKTLMATRASILTPEHVQALNMIDLEFQGEKYRSVTVAWKTYLDHLSSYPRDNQAMQPVWSDRNVDLQAALLIAMGRALGYEFDEVQVKKGIYFPEGHGTIDTENRLIRRGLVGLLYGDRSLKMDVQKMPSDEEQAKEFRGLRDDLRRALRGEGALHVEVKKSDEY